MRGAYLLKPNLPMVITSSILSDNERRTTNLGADASTPSECLWRIAPFSRLL